MPAYLITWNPVIWPWEDFAEQAAAIREGRDMDGGWSCGRTMRIAPGNRLWLVRVGKEPRGIIGAALATSSSYRCEHWADPSKIICCIDLRWERLLDADAEPILRLAELRDRFPGVRWTPQGSGMSVPAAVEPKLEKLWAELVGG